VTDKKPADYAARQAIRTRLDVTMLVEAAAGTGKTTSLVARMVNLVNSERARASNIAAITFTVKAAAQLRERFQEEVEQALVRPDDNVHRGREQVIDLPRNHPGHLRVLGHPPPEREHAEADMARLVAGDGREAVDEAG